MLVGVVLLLAGAGLAVAVAVDRFSSSHRTQPTRPGLQRILDGLVEGPAKLAPGATAYVAGPRGTWLSAAGVSDTATGAAMRPDARMRLESVSKIYTATLIMQLAQERRLRLDDTVARWLPGLFPYGNRITIRELLTMQSGLIDNNDIRNASPSVRRQSSPASRMRGCARSCSRSPPASRRIRPPRSRRSGGCGSQPGSRCCTRPASGSTTRTSATTCSG